MKIVPAPFSVRFEEIDAKRAQELLDTNIATNRNQSKSRAGRYTTDIVSGHWMTTHQGIALNENGQLIDGQHRLKGIVDADKIVPGISVTMMICEGVPMNTFTTMDAGMNRTAHSFLEGSYGTSRVALARAIISINDSDGVASVVNVRRVDVPTHRIIDLLQENPEVAAYGEKYAKLAGAATKKMIKGTSAAGLLIGGYIAGREDNSKWDLWWGEVTDYLDAKGLPAGSPVKALTMCGDSSSNRSGEAYMRAIIAGKKYADGETYSKAIAIRAGYTLKVW